MYLPNFEYCGPESVTEACQVLAGFGTRAKILAGGTDLLDKMKKGELKPEIVVSLNRIDQLKSISYQKDRGIVIGARATQNEIAKSPLLQQRYSSICEAAHHMANNQIRNMGTVGGNIVNAVPSADLPPILRITKNHQAFPEGCHNQRPLLNLKGGKRMIFELSEAHLMIRDLARDFANNELLPGIEERDEQELFSRAIFDKMGNLGFCGVVIPEEYGGAEADYLSYVIVVEELSKVDAAMGVTVSAHTSLGANPIWLAGTHEQKLKYLKPLAEGKALGALGLTEPNSGSDVAAIRCIYTDGGDCWIINGTKIFITNGYYADTYIVVASKDRSLGNKGLSAFIVEKGTPGFRFGPKLRKMGIRSSATYELIFEDCKIPKGNLLGSEGEGFKLAMKTLDGGRIGIASQALGIAEGAYEAAVKYAKERAQFGKPIASLQNTQFTLADMTTRIEAARLLVYQAAYLASAKKPYSKQSAMAKLYASETAMWVTTKAVQIFGGYGYTRDYPVERMMRDAKITEIYEGTSEIQRLVIGSHCLKEF